MSRKRSDALQALVAEVVDLAADLAQARDLEEHARQEFVAARQVLDLEAQKRQAIEDRLENTEQALGIIQARDEVSDETLTALRQRAAGR